MKILHHRLLFLYDCRNSNGDYLGRIIVDLDAFDDPDDFTFQRSVLDSDFSLVYTCTWKYKVVDSSLLSDYLEFGYDA